MGAVIILSRLILTFNEHVSILDQIKNFFIQIRGKGDEMWFLALMFGTDALFYLIVLALKDKKEIIAFTFVLFMMSYLYSIVINIPLPWHVQMYGASCLFMAIGYSFKGKIEKIFDKYNYLITFTISFMAFLILWLVFNVFGTYKPVSFYDYGNNLLFYFAIIFFSMIALISFSKLLKCPKLIAYIGQNTLILYGLHGKLESIYETFIDKIIFTSNLFIKIILGIFGVAIITIILLGICYMINKYFPFLIGRRKEVKNNG